MTSDFETLLKQLDAKRDLLIVHLRDIIDRAEPDDRAAKTDEMLRCAYSRGYERARIEQGAWEATHDATSETASEAFEDDECVWRAMQAQMSPEAVATVAAALSAAESDNPEVDRQLRWLAGNLTRNLGGPAAANRLSCLAAD